MEGQDLRSEHTSVDGAIHWLRVEEKGVFVKCYFAFSPSPLPISSKLKVKRWMEKIGQQ